MGAMPLLVQLAQARNRKREHLENQGARLHHVSAIRLCSMLRPALPRKQLPISISDAYYIVCCRQPGTCGTC